MNPLAGLESLIEKRRTYMDAKTDDTADEYFAHRTTFTALHAEPLLAHVKQLEADKKRMEDIIQESLRIASDDHDEVFGGDLNKRESAIIEWKRRARECLKGKSDD